MAGPELPEPVDTDFGIDGVGENPSKGVWENPPGPIDTEIGIGGGREIPSASPLGAGYLLLVVRELSGRSQRHLARAVNTSQPTLATLETGNRIPTIRTLMRVAQSAGFELVIGLRRPETPRPDPGVLHAQGFDLLGTLRMDPLDGLADFVVLREPSPFEGPR